MGHPYYDVVDNSTSFEGKLVRTISSVCHRVGIDVGDRLLVESKKRKFLIAIMPGDDIFPDYQDFEVGSSRPRGEFRGPPDPLAVPPDPMAGPPDPLTIIPDRPASQATHLAGNR